MRIINSEREGRGIGGDRRGECARGRPTRQVCAHSVERPASADRHDSTPRRCEMFEIAEFGVVEKAGVVWCGECMIFVDFLIQTADFCPSVFNCFCISLYLIMYMYMYICAI